MGALCKYYYLLSSLHYLVILGELDEYTMRYLGEITEKPVVSTDREYLSGHSRDVAVYNAKKGKTT